MFKVTIALILLSTTMANRCGWVYSHGSATINTDYAIGFLGPDSGFVVIHAKPPCKPRRRWAYVNSNCTATKGSRGHIIPKFLGGPAWGINCLSQTKLEQDRFNRIFKPFLSNPSGLILFSRIYNLLIICQTKCYIYPLVAPSQ